MQPRFVHHPADRVTSVNRCRGAVGRCKRCRVESDSHTSKRHCPIHSHASVHRTCSGR
jgi:hypothetical protein